MIKLYIGSSCSSSRRAKRWLITHDIPFIEQNLIRQPLTKNEFIHLLKLTNNGVTEMLSTHSISYKNLVHRIDELSLSELYIEIRTSPSLLKNRLSTTNLQNF
nr:Spx/MgsR family RNA polymerase-binding regulatory protein [Enterococcus faecium]